MQVRFWGVRGSIAVSGEPYVETGGNTSCVEITHQGHRLILDGGTGLRALGDAYGHAPIEATVLFSHVHWDHIQGVPFFAPAFHPESRLTFVGARRDSGGVREALAAQMRPPTFPITLDTLKARLAFRDVSEVFEVGPFRITPRDMDHPDGVFAFRVEAGGRSLVYATDIEHGERLDPRLLELAEGVDLLVHDAQFTRAEYEGRLGPCRKGWGHSSWEDAVHTAQTAHAGRLALFHHDPARRDRGVSEIEQAARQRFEGAFAAREGALVPV